MKRNDPQSPVAPISQVDVDIDDVLEDEAIEQIKRKSVSGAVSYLFRTLLLNGIGIVTAFVLSGYLSPEDFGVYGYVTMFVGLFVFFSDVGLAAALVQKKQEPSQDDYRTAFTIQQLLSFLILICFVILAATGLVQQKTGPVGTWLLLALGLSFPLASLKTIPSIMLERRLDFNKLVVPQIFEQLIYNVTLIIFAVRGMGVQSYTFAILARSALGVIVMYLVQPWPLGLAWKKDSLRTLLSFGVKFQLNDLLARIKDNLFFILLGRFLPLHEFGYINWAKNWSMYPYNLTVQNVMAITFPTFSRLQKNTDALAKAIDKSLFFITFAIFPILVGMSVFIWPLVNLVEKYHKWQPAVLSLVLFSLGIAWSAISTPLTNTLNAIGKINTTLKLMVIWTILTWIITPLAIYFFGFQGVAIASFAIAFTSFLPMIEVRKIVKIHVWENTWRQLLAAAAMAGVGVIGMPIWVHNYFGFGIGMVVTSLTYMLVFLLVGFPKLRFEFASLRMQKK